MTLEQRLAKAFGLYERALQRRAIPWSVWTRNTVLPLLIIAVWSRAWIGWWCLLPIAAALAWNWINPHLFPTPEHYRHWASRAVLGERIWMARKEKPVPELHRIAPHVLTAAAAAGAMLVILGVWRFHTWTTLLGAALVYAGKLWFLDRMVWLQRDVAGAIIIDHAQPLASSSSMMISKRAAPVISASMVPTRFTPAPPFFRAVTV
jgi:hypothetical protein